MRFLVLLAVVFAGFSVPALAKKSTKAHWRFTPGEQSDFTPYIGRQKLGQRSHKDDDAWTPRDWAQNEGDAKAIIRDFYEGNILVKQYIGSKNIPVLRVGEAFVRLSNFDQKRVLAFIDYVFEITTTTENGMYYVYYEGDDKEPLGLYNKYGFQSY